MRSGTFVALFAVVMIAGNSAAEEKTAVPLGSSVPDPGFGIDALQYDLPGSETDHLKLVRGYFCTLCRPAHRDNI